MAKPKAPRWLTQSFADGVDERLPRRAPKPAYPGASPYCFLAAFDDRRRPCTQKLERFHWINAQRIEAALGALLPADGAWFALDSVEEYRPGVLVPETFQAWQFLGRDDLILLAAWDSRFGDFGCEGHHRRFDSQLTPTLIVPRAKVPARVISAAEERGIDAQLSRFPT